MDMPVKRDDLSIRCSKCYKLLCKQDAGGVVTVKFQRLVVEVRTDELIRIDCPRCGHINQFTEDSSN